MMSKKRILSLLLLGVMLVSCAPQATQQQADGGAAGTTAPGTAATPQASDRGLRLAISLETPTLAPGQHTSVHGHWKNVLTHNGLFRFPYDSLIPIPDLAADVRALSDTLFEFTLHQGVMFHNGEELTAYDVVASLEYVRTYPLAMAFHGSVVGAEAVDRYTVIIDTGTPNAMLFGDLGSQANFIMPRSLIEAGHDFGTDPVGSGPFTFREWNLGNLLIFDRFEDYFNTERIPRVAYLDWRIIPEGSSRTIALEAGEIDFITEVSFPDLSRLEANPDITVAEIPGITYNYMLFNHNLPQFSNVYVRRAIDMAFDKEAMVMAAYEGRGIPIWVQFPPVFEGVSHEGIRSFDPEGARQILREQNIDPATLGFQMYVMTEDMRRKAEVAQANLAEIGIPATIATIDLATWLSQTAGGHHEAAFGNFTSSCQLFFMRATTHLGAIGATNRSQFNDPEFSALIDQMVATIDLDERLALFYYLSGRANENPIWVPINMSMLYRAFNANLYVPELAPGGFMYFDVVAWMQ